MKLELFTTYSDEKRWNEHQFIEFVKDADEIENEVLNLYPEEEFQMIEGFGGAITDAAGFVYAQMNEQQKKELMETYFSPERMNYEVVRVHMDSCDFSTEMYEAMTDGKDRNLESFSFARTEKYIIPMLCDAQRTAGKQLKLMLSPWSPPAFMKTNGERRYGGSLKEEYRDFWADYICRYIEEFEKRGFCVQRISLQNEAKAVQTWDSCTYSAEEEKEFLENHMSQALIRHKLEHVEIFIWDHNKERIYERVSRTIDEKNRNMVSGVAFHWYSGEHFEALDLIQRKYPGLKMIVSESCIEFRVRGNESIAEQANELSHEVLGDLNHGATAFYDWNILLDETGGPNHAGNLCNAPFLYDRDKKELMPQLIQKYFAHFTCFIKPGAVRIGFTRYTDKLEVTAFKNLDGKIVIVLLNHGKSDVPVVLRMQEEIAQIVVGAESIVSGVIF